MHKFARCFAEFCEKNLNITDREPYKYGSLPVCILDCVYSLRTKYYSVAIPVIDRYAERYMKGNKYSSADTISAFINNVDACGGPGEFADRILKNHQKLGGKGKIPKEEICYKLAQYLSYLHIETLEDFQNFESQELLEVVIRSVKGIGDAGTNYLFMLAGDPNRCKPDAHVHQCIIDVCGSDVSNEECQRLFTEVVKLLQNKYPFLTVRILDSIIWEKYQGIK